MRIRNYVVDLVFSHPDAETRIMSERELCAKFEVTRPTARRALRDLIDEGWLSVRPGRGTFVTPRRGPLKNCKRIAFLLNDGKQIDFEPFHLDILARVCEALKRLNVRFKLANVSGSPESFAAELSDLHPDGILWFRPMVKLLEPIERLRSRLPVHLFGGPPTGGDGNTAIDQHQAGRLAAAWFLERGHSQVAFVGSSGFSGVTRDVFAGWNAEFAARGQNFNQELAVDWEEDAAKALAILLARGGVEGVFSFGAKLPEVAEAFGSKWADCPVMSDDSQQAPCEFQRQVAARLVLSPPELTTLAVERLYKALENPGLPCPELVLEPSIKEERL